MTCVYLQIVRMLHNTVSFHHETYLEIHDITLQRMSQGLEEEEAFCNRLYGISVREIGCITITSNLQNHLSTRMGIIWSTLENNFNFHSPPI